MLAMSAPAPRPSAAKSRTSRIRSQSPRGRWARFEGPPAGLVCLLRPWRLEPARGHLPLALARVVVELGLVAARGRLRGDDLAARDLRRPEYEGTAESLESGGHRRRADPRVRHRVHDLHRRE